MQYLSIGIGSNEINAFQPQLDHAHFYQPSREDPYSGIIPQEQGAEPFRNWNEKINADCYAPNARLGNFEKISFNLGPTLTRWMEQNAQDTLALITESERRYMGSPGKVAIRVHTPKYLSPLPN